MQISIWLESPSNFKLSHLEYLKFLLSKRPSKRELCVMHIIARRECVEGEFIVSLLPLTCCVNMGKRHNIQVQSETCANGEKNLDNFLFLNSTRRLKIISSIKMPQTVFQGEQTCLTLSRCAVITIYINLLFLKPFLNYCL
jgi:hypothetical protein